MFGRMLSELIKNVVGDTKKKNEEDPNVKTADPRVFEHLEKKVESTTRDADENTLSRQEMYRRMNEAVKEAQVENERDPEIETAHTSVFEDMMKKLEEMQKKAQEETEAAPKSDAGTGPFDLGSMKTGEILPPVFEIPNSDEVAGEAAGAMMVTNSGGGSLAMRIHPDMGAPTNSTRIPHGAAIRVLQYSDKQIRLDGKDSTWVEVDYDGQRGWILDAYLGGPSMR